MNARLFLAVSTLFLISAGGLPAQDVAGTQAIQQQPARTRNIIGDRIVMRAGALTEIVGNLGSRIDIDTMLPGGIRVTPGGTIYLPDGTTATLQDRQALTLSGKIRPATQDEVRIADATLDSGTAGVGQSLLDRSNLARDAVIQANTTPNPNTNDRTTGVGQTIIPNGSSGAPAANPAAMPEKRVNQPMPARQQQQVQQP